MCAKRVQMNTGQVKHCHRATARLGERDAVAPQRHATVLNVGNQRKPMFKTAGPCALAWGLYTHTHTQPTVAKYVKNMQMQFITKRWVNTAVPSTFTCTVMSTSAACGRTVYVATMPRPSGCCAQVHVAVASP